MPAINFNAYLHTEERKQGSGNEKMTLDQFARKVHCKTNLLYALQVKGKCSSLLLKRALFRSILSTREKILHYGLPAMRSEWT